MSHPRVSKPNGKPRTAIDSDLWTAERCYKLLRQLDSRLASLRRICLGHNATQEHARAEGKSSKRVRYTYGSNGVSLAGHNSFKVSMRNPQAKRRTCSETMASIGDALDLRYPTTRVLTGTSLGDLYGRLHSLRQCTTGECYRIYQANFEWLVSFLYSTRYELGDIHPKSLLSMCLRKLPACIDDIASWQRKISRTENGPRTSLEVSFDMFKQLARFGLMGRGWKPLKSAVRAQALYEVHRAVVEGLFSSHYIELLVKLLARFGCVQESAGLVTGLRNVLPLPRGLDDDFSTSRNLAPLQALLDATSNRSWDQGKNYVFEGVSHLLQEKLLPISWISTRGFHALLKRSLIAIAQGTSGPQTLAFLSTVLGILCVHPSKTGYDTLDDEPRMQNLVETLSSLIALALESAALEAAETSQTATLSINHPHTTRSFISVLDRCVYECCERDNSHCRGGSLSIYPVLALYIIESGDSAINQAPVRWQTREVVREMLVNVSDTESVAGHASRLMGATSQKLSTAQGVYTRTEFIGLCQNLEKMGPPGKSLSLLNPTGLRLPAMKNAGSYGGDSSQAKTSVRPLQDPQSFSWQWEEGIGEWIATAAAQVSAAGQLVKPTRLRAYSYSFRSREDRHMSDKINRAPADLSAAGDTSSAVTDKAGIEARRGGLSLLTIAAQGQGHVRTAEMTPGSLTACKMLDTSAQGIYIKPSGPGRLSLDGPLGMGQDEETQVQVAKDLITRTTNHATRSSRKPVFRRRPKSWGQLLIVSDTRSKQAGTVGKKRGRPPANECMEVDWDNIVC